MSAVSKEEYLKRYLSGSADSSAKKKSKKNKTKENKKESRMKIMDDDTFASVSSEYVTVDSGDDEEDVQLKEEIIKKKVEEAPKFRSAFASISIKKECSPSREDGDSSPRRRARHDSESPPHRRTRHDSDNSPVRGRQQMSPDNSPPRRRQRQDSDNSPKRSTTRRRHDSDESPPRRRQRQDSDASPPRRRQRKDSDESPPRRNRGKSPSESRGHRISKVSSKTEGRREVDSDSSPVRKRVNKREDSDESPPRKQKREEDPTTDNKQRTLDGKMAGLQNAKDLKAESEKIREKERNMFEQMDDTRSGRNAETVRREKIVGRRKENPEDKAKKDREALKQSELEEKYKSWNKGVRQLKERQDFLEEAARVAAEPLARAADDDAMNEHLKEILHEDDPMAAIVAKKREKVDIQGGKTIYPTYNRPFPPNRFSVRPGYRWDGVDRGNGFEGKLSIQGNKKRAEEAEYYKNIQTYE